MNSLRLSGWFIIGASFILGFVLTILPLPGWAIWLRPAWVPLVLLYWSIALPHRIGLEFAFLIGLLLDSLIGTLLGEHALALTIITYVTLKFYRQIRVFPVWQQAGVVLLLLVGYELLLLGVRGFADQPTANNWLILVSVFTSMLLWPWLAIVMHNLRRRFRIS